jgi:predicted alpha/beta-fold hydrolase
MYCGKVAASRARGFLTQSYLKRVLVLVLCALSLNFACSAVELPGQTEGDLPEYDFHYKSGLYATIVGFLTVKDVEIKNQKTYKLKIDSFKKKVPVKGIIQRGNAPLVVVLLGVDGKADGALGKLWPAWYSEAGYHVLTFDSTFQSSFIEISGHGVTGNISAEAERVREMIAAFLKQTEVRGKVSKIGIVGMSYGGLEALVLGQMAKEGQLPFKVDAVQAYSPPIRLQKTGEMIDRWYSEDRWQFTLADLANKLAGHRPVDPDAELPFSDSIMRAAIAAVFRLGLVDVIVRNDKQYKLNVLPRGNNYDDTYVKRDYAALMGYSQFMNEVSYPYWKTKLNMNRPSDLTDPVELPTLLTKQPSFSEVIIAGDDPFNTVEDTEALMSNYSGSNLTVLPHGGHLGFVNEKWTRAKLLSLFKNQERAQTSTVEMRN